MRCDRVLLPLMLGGILLISGCSLFGSGTLPSGEPGHEWRAAWVLNIQEDVRSEAQARQLVEEARSLHLNTLYVVSVYQGSAFYPSQVAPVYVPPGSYRPLAFDPLAAMLEEAHDPGKKPVEIYAWVSLCQAWQSRDLIPPSHPVVRHPDWLTAHYNPNQPPDIVPEYWLDPGVPAVQRYAGEICRELANKYPLDGLLLDTVAYRDRGFGYNPVALRRFAEETGRSDRPSPDDPVWQAWKARQVTHLFERATLMARAQRMNLPVAVVGAAEGPLTPRYEDSQPFVESGQNWPVWFNSGVLDCLVLRNFKRQASGEESKQFNDWLTFAKIQADGEAIVCGLGAKENALLATQEQIREVRRAGVQGMAFWTYRDNNSEGRPRKALFELLQMTVFSSWAKPPVIPWLQKIHTGILIGEVRTPSAVPISNVAVYFPEINRETRTHPDGTYVLFDVPAGREITPKAFYGGALHPAEEPVALERGQIRAADITVSTTQ